MKKILLLFILLIVACSSVSQYDTGFKNHVFNQPLRPLSSGTGYVYITPKSVDFRTPLDKNKLDTQGKCDLIENKQDRITLKCQVESWGEPYNRYYTYIIKEIPLFIPSCLRILEYNYDNPKDFPKDEIFANKYCVTPPDYMKSKSD